MQCFSELEIHFPGQEIHSKNQQLVSKNPDRRNSVSFWQLKDMDCAHLGIIAQKTKADGAYLKDIIAQLRILKKDIARRNAILCKPQPG